MWKIITIILTSIILFVWLITDKKSEMPNETIIKNYYQKQLDNNYEQAVKQFGSLVTSNKKVIIKDFYLEKCEENPKNIQDFICKVTTKLETPKNGLEERKLEFFLKKQDNGFDIKLKQV